MKLFITGGAGFIGGNLIRHILTQSKFDVVNFDKLTYAGNLKSLADLHDHGARYEFVRGDVAEAAKVQEALSKHQPDAILHLAAESHVDRSIQGPAEFIQTNIIGTYVLLCCACRYYESLSAEQQSIFRFLHVSTDEVYGSLDHHGAGFSESSRYDPHSPYSASKAASDHLARAWHTTYGLPVLVTNCSNNYGPFQYPEKLIPVVILNALHGRPIPVYGRGENVRDWLYVEDHASALLKVATMGAIGETYNIGGNSERKNIDLVMSICELLDEMAPPRLNSRLNSLPNSYCDLLTFVTDRPGHDLRYAIDSSKLEAELKWTPSVDLDSGLRKTVSWYLNHGAWWQELIRGS